MDLADLCSSCKCGLCCFFFDKAPAFEKPSKEFLKKYSDKIIKRNYLFFTAYRPSLNKNFFLVSEAGIKYYACSFLEAKINEESNTVENLLCSIHESDERPYGCSFYPMFPVKFPNSCSSLFFIGVKRIYINGNAYSLNKDIELLLAQYASCNAKMRSRFRETFIKSYELL